MEYGYINETEEKNIKEKIKKLEQRGVLRENIFIENSNIKRTKLNELLSIINEFDSFISIDIMEAALTTKNICNLIKICSEKKVRLILGSCIWDCHQNDIKTQGMVEMANIISSFEKRVIQDRIKNRLNKANKTGRPLKTYESLPEDVKKNYESYESGVIGINEYAEICGISRQLTLKYIKIIEEMREIEHEKEKNF